VEERRKKISCTNGIVGSGICILGFVQCSILAPVPMGDFVFVKEVVLDYAIDLRFFCCILASSWCYRGFAGLERKRSRSLRLIEMLLKLCSELQVGCYSLQV
jgi:hypothetical protein